MKLGDPERGKRSSVPGGNAMTATAATGGLAEWAERSALLRVDRLTAAGPVPGRLRFVFYGRVSTEDWQDPVMSRARQREQAGALVRGHGQIVAELFDVGESRTVAWARRPQSAALVTQLADPDRGWAAIVIGEYERAFYGSQYAAMAPLFEHYGVQLWMPEVGGRVDYASEHDEKTMTGLGLSSKREITRTRIRVRTAMAVQTREQGRYLAGWLSAVRVPASLMPGRTRTRRTPRGGAARTASTPIRRPRRPSGGSSCSGWPGTGWRGSRGP